MSQYIYLNNQNLYFKQENKQNNQCNKEVSLQRKKKSVSFNPNISIVNVENWKAYNDDAADDTEYIRHKREKAYYKENENNENSREKDKDYCNCNIF